MKKVYVVSSKGRHDEYWRQYGIFTTKEKAIETMKKAREEWYEKYKKTEKALNDINNLNEFIDYHYDIEEIELNKYIEF